MHAQEHKDKVRIFFDKEENYLTQNPNIITRAFLIRHFFTTINNKEILDFGCGNGRLTIQFLSNNRVTFVDISSEMLKIVKKEINDNNAMNATIIQSSIQDFNSDKKYDVVFCIGVLAHVPSIEDTLKHISKFVKINGYLVLQYTDWDNIYTKVSRLWVQFFKKGERSSRPYSLNKTRKKEMMKLLKNFPFDLVKEDKYPSSVLGFGRVSLLLAARLNLLIGKMPLLNLLCGEKLIFMVNNGHKKFYEI
jgi:2-polyprenyl-3-methyl-5-hydroxy-6-metoxy-1,4-benzoquinol methylase